MKDLMNALSKELMDKHPDVDYGGCCVVAAHVAKHLSRYTEVEVQATDCWIDSFDDLRNANPEWLTRTSFDHVYIRYRENGKWRYFDATDGVRSKGPTSFFASRVKGKVTLQEATKLANHNRWNEDFGIETNRPKVRRLITRFFNKHKEEFERNKH